MTNTQDWKNGWEEIKRSFSQSGLFDCAPGSEKELDNEVALLFERSLETAREEGYDKANKTTKKEWAQAKETYIKEGQITERKEILKVVEGMKATKGTSREQWLASTSYNVALSDLHTILVGRNKKE